MPGLAEVIHLAGKDRTGVLVGRVHHILGVSPEDTLKDYMASLNAKGLIDVASGIVATLAGRFGARRAEGIVQRLLEVREEYLRISIASIVSRSGSIEHYFAESGVNCARLDAIRARYII